MSRRNRTTAILLTLLLIPLLLATGEAAQGRGGGGRQAQPRSGPSPAAPGGGGPVRPVGGARTTVFVGGYFYDPFFGPYPWWPRTAYPYGYFPIFDNTADVRLQVRPRDAQVYVDGFYAGIVDDFDGAFQRLNLPPGGHTIALYLDGYRTIRHNLYLRPGSTTKIHDDMERLPAGAVSDLPPVAPPVPPPPAGSFSGPRTPPRRPLPPVARPEPLPEPGPGRPEVGPVAGFGTLVIRVQPANADVWVDGDRWESSDDGQFELHLPPGRHRVEVARPGFRRFATDVEVRDGESTPLNVSLAGER